MPVPETTMRAVAGTDELIREATQRQLQKTALEIAGPHPTTLETQLAHRIALCGMVVAQMENFFAGDIGINTATWMAIGRRLDGARKRHLSVVKTLAVVYKAQSPDVQINVAEKQVNIDTLKP